MGKHQNCSSCDLSCANPVRGKCFCSFLSISFILLFFFPSFFSATMSNQFHASLVTVVKYLIKSVKRGAEKLTCLRPGFHVARVNLSLVKIFQKCFFCIFSFIGYFFMPKMK